MKFGNLRYPLGGEKNPGIWNLKVKGILCLVYEIIYMKIFKIAAFIAGWIMPNGEVVEINIAHEKYVYINFDKFGIKKEEFMKDNMRESYYDVEDKLLYWLAFKNSAVRFFIGAGNSLAIEGTNNGISKNIETIHRLYNRYGVDGIIIDIVHSMKEQDRKWKFIHNISELYSYASNQFSETSKYASSIVNGWILPDGTWVNIPYIEEHIEYLMNNSYKFGIKEEDLEGKNKDDIYWEAFKNGAIRYASSCGSLNLSCTKESLMRKVKEIHETYKRLGCNRGFYIDVVKSSTNYKEIMIDDIEDLYNYANSNNLKIYKIANNTIE